VKVVYLASARDDLVWMHRYYVDVFPEGASKARKQFRATENILGSNPEIGHPTEWDSVREFSIPNIPFSVIYRIKEGRIEVLRIWDERRNRDQDIV
jgi:plasmid stabilization system protein ParE